MAKRKRYQKDTGGRLATVVSKAEAATQEAVQELSVSEIPDKELAQKVVDIVKQDTFLELEDKKFLLSELESKYLFYFSLENCPSDYVSLKEEAKFLARMTQHSFVFMAQRLLIIRDKELYKEDGYKDFQSFIDNELELAKRSVYNYIDLISLFGSDVFIKDKELAPSKLIPAIPLLKAEQEDIPKNEIKDQFIEYAKTHSARDAASIAKKLKVQYGISKSKIQDSHYEKALRLCYRMSYSELSALQAELAKLLEEQKGA